MRKIASYCLFQDFTNYSRDATVSPTILSLTPKLNGSLSFSFYINIYIHTDYSTIQLQIVQYIRSTVGCHLICLVNGHMYMILINLPICLIASSNFKPSLKKKKSIPDTDYKNIVFKKWKLNV